MSDQSTLSRQWDSIADDRDTQLRANSDKSFSNVLAPWVLNTTRNDTAVLDVGCGTGVLTEMLVEQSSSVIGVDPSGRSIEIAREKSAHLTPRPHYEIATIENWAARNCSSRVEVAVLNMVLMDVPDVSLTLRSIASLPNIHQVVATFTHPAFWPRYWGYDALPGFDYSSEFAVEATFRTGSFDYSHLTTHYHRPLQKYFQEAQKVGFAIACVDEMRGTEAIDDFRYPRFIGLELTR